MADTIVLSIGGDLDEQDIQIMEKQFVQHGSKIELSHKPCEFYCLY
ncbi:hypothetical protein [Absicoccus intestinalis]|nr:hypothetical protein [Absicoccus sp. CLA-KB-P134]